MTPSAQGGHRYIRLDITAACGIVNGLEAKSAIGAREWSREWMQGGAPRRGHFFASIALMALGSLISMAAGHP